MFSSILDQGVRRVVADELGRVVRRGGVVLWYDLRVNNPRNPEVRRLGRHEIAGLFPGWHLTLERVTLAPPIARTLAGRADVTARLLAAVPWLRTHYLGVLRKP
jgi:hypothetical protein